MPIEWNLKTYLAKKHAIYSATELRKVIIKQTGIIISLQNLCNYLNEKPKMIRLETIDILCSALNCKLENFCRIIPSSRKKKDNEKLSYKNTPISKRGVGGYPCPKDYR